MNLKKFVAVLFTILLLFLLVNLTYSQDIKVTNVTFKQVNDSIVINYDLFGPFNKKIKVTLSLSDDNGFTYRIIPKSVRGDIGEDVMPGEQKLIEWNYKLDYPDGLEGEDFVFAVDAEIRNKGNNFSSFFLGFCAIGGVGAIWYFMTEPKNEETPPSNGSIAIVVPGNVN